MQAQTLQAEVRQTSGKGPARQLRMRGLIPAIYYGPGTDPVKLTVSPSALTKAIKGEYGRNQVLELEFDGKKGLALLKDLAIDPASREILHADFYSVAEDRTVETKVPFASVGRSIGVQMGGVLRKLFRDLPVRAFPQNVPAVIEVDVEDLDTGAIVTVADLKLDEGVEVTYPPSRRVLSIDVYVAKEEEVEEEAGAVAAEPAAEAEETS